MTKLGFRILVLLPAVAILVAVAVIFRGHPEWPAPALQYLAWYQATPSTASENWAFIASEVSVFGLVAASALIVTSATRVYEARGCI